MVSCSLSVRVTRLQQAQTIAPSKSCNSISCHRNQFRKKKPHSSLKNGRSSRNRREAFKFNQQDSGRLSRASSAIPACSAVIVKMDRVEIHKAERKTQEHSGPSLHSFGHHNSNGKSPNPKTVHFDSDLEYVRYFSKTDKPLAISTSTLHIGSNLFSEKQKVNQQIGSSLRWEIFTPNFPDDTSIRKSIPVRVQRLYFSRRYMTLFVFIVVANLAFEKSVTCRFTRDYWKTISETPGQYYSTPSSKGGRNCDTFVVGIRLTDVDGLDLSPLFLCVRYIVGDQELWDNNSGVNFEVDFKKMIN
ncbi:hypothetical protein FPOAC2_13668 [Fusarium poae]|jgi:hypothetical protein